VVLVLHHINHAARYSDCIAVLDAGRIYAVGRPEEVVTAVTLRQVFGVEADIWTDADNCPVYFARGLANKNNRE
jgi:iron complex transport system ATP-binding protein